MVLLFESYFYCCILHFSIWPGGRYSFLGGHDYYKLMRDWCWSPCLLHLCCKILGTSIPPGQLNMVADCWGSDGSSSKTGTIESTWVWGFEVLVYLMLVFGGTNQSGLAGSLAGISTVAIRHQLFLCKVMYKQQHIHTSRWSSVKISKVKPHSMQMPNKEDNVCNTFSLMKSNEEPSMSKALKLKWSWLLLMQVQTHKSNPLQLKNCLPIEPSRCLLQLPNIESEM